MDREDFFDILKGVFKNAFYAIVVLDTISICLFYIVKMGLPHYTVKTECVDTQYIGTHAEVLKKNFKNVRAISEKKTATADYVMVDEGYTFLGIEGYHKAATYGDRVIFATKDLPLNNIDVSKFVLAKNWQDVGLRHTNYDKITLRMPYHYDLLGGYIKTNYSVHFVSKFDTTPTLDPNTINLIFASDLAANPKYKVLDTNAPIAYAKYDLYIKDGVDVSIPEYEGLEILVDDVYENVLDIGYDYSPHAFPVFAAVIACIIAYGFIFYIVAEYIVEEIDDRKEYEERIKNLEKERKAVRDWYKI